MNVLIATDGQIDSASAARFAAQLAGDDGEIVVFTAIEVPRRLLTELRAIYSENQSSGVDADAEYVGVKAPGSGVAPSGWPGDDAMITRYLRDKEAQVTEPVVEALRAMGAKSTTAATESESPAGAIVDAAERHKADVIVIGSHGQGRFEGLLGSTGTKLARRSPIPVLVLR